jgi:hypothetical protein
MADGDFSSLELRGPVREDDFDLFEAVDTSSRNPEDHIYSCVAICRKDWNDRWPENKVPGERRRTIPCSPLSRAPQAPNDRLQPPSWRLTSRSQSLER